MLEALEHFHSILFCILGVLLGMVLIIGLVMLICESIDKRKQRREQLKHIEAILRDEMVAKVRSEYMGQLQSLAREIDKTKCKVLELWRRMDDVEDKTRLDIPELKRKITRLERKVRRELDFEYFAAAYNRIRLQSAGKRRRRII